MGELIASVAVGIVAILILLPLVQRAGSTFGGRLAQIMEKKRMASLVAAWQADRATPVLVGEKGRHDAATDAVLKVLQSMGQSGRVFELMEQADLMHSWRLAQVKRALQASDAAVYVGGAGAELLTLIATAATSSCRPVLLVPEDLKLDLPQGVYRLDLRRAEQGDVEELSTVLGDLRERRVQALFCSAEASLARGERQYSACVQQSWMAAEQQLVGSSLLLDQLLEQLDAGEATERSCAQAIRRAVDVRRKVTHERINPTRAEAEAVLSATKLLVRELQGEHFGVPEFLEPLHGPNLWQRSSRVSAQQSDQEAVRARAR